MKKHVQKTISLLLALVLAVSLTVPTLAAPEEEPSPAPVITLDSETGTLTVGETLTLEPAITTDSTEEYTVQWTSSDPDVATAENGVVTALNPGEAIITASVTIGETEYTANCTVTVTPAEPAPDPVPEPEPAADQITLSSVQVKTQCGQFQTITLTSPAVTLLRGETSVADQYTVTCSWTDSTGVTLSTGKMLVITPSLPEDMTITCTITATSKENPESVLAADCTYLVDVLPTTMLSGMTILSAGPATLAEITDAEGTVSLLDQLTKGNAASSQTPHIPGLTHVVFDLTSVTGAGAGSLNVKRGVSYYADPDAAGEKLSDLVFTPAGEGTYQILFTAFGKEPYFGQLTITVTDGTVAPDGTIYCGCTGFTFAVSDFFRSTDEDPIASMVFGQPSSGKLLRNLYKGSGTPDDGASYYTDSAANGTFHISTLSYLPAPGFGGKAEIPVTYTTRSGRTVQDTLKIEVAARTSSAYFSDITPDDVGTWAASAADFAYSFGLVNGVEPGLFAPNATMTRAMLVTILYRASGSPEVTITTNFTDLDVGSYYYSAVVWANVMGIVNGFSETEFSPDSPVTRQQIAAILYRYADAMGNHAEAAGDLNAFIDRGSVDSYAEVPISWAVGRGIISGTTENTLSPTSNATRAQVVVMLHRYLVG